MQRKNYKKWACTWSFRSKAKTYLDENLGGCQSSFLMLSMEKLGISS